MSEVVRSASSRICRRASQYSSSLVIVEGPVRLRCESARSGVRNSWEASAVNSVTRVNAALDARRASR